MLTRVGPTQNPEPPGREQRSEGQRPGKLRRGRRETTPVSLPDIEGGDPKDTRERHRLGHTLNAFITEVKGEEKLD